MEKLPQLFLYLLMTFSGTAMFAQLEEGRDFTVGAIDIVETPRRAYELDEGISAPEGWYSYFKGQWPFFLDEIYFFDGETSCLIHSESVSDFEFMAAFNEGVLVRKRLTSGPSTYFFLTNAGEVFDLDIEAFSLSRSLYVEETGLFVFVDGDLLRATRGTDGVVRTLQDEVRSQSHGTPFTFQGKMVVPIDGDLYISDGTFSGTDNLTEDRLNGPPRSIAFTDEYILFQFDERIYSSDGTTEGTQPITEPESFFGIFDMDFTETANGVVFHAEAWGQGQGEELWYTNGTAEGTYLLREFAEGPADGISSSHEWEKVGDYVVFVTEDLNEVRRYWSTDGTVEGTIMLDFPPLLPNQASSSWLTTTNAVTSDGDAYFLLSVGFSSRTQLFGNNPALTGSEFILVDSFPDRFPLSDAVAAEERLIIPPSTFQEKVYAIDTPLEAVRDVATFDDAEEVHLVADGVVYFKGVDGSTSNIGNEYYRTDGTPEGTNLLIDAVPGQLGLWREEIFAINGEVYLYGVGEELTEVLFRVDSEADTAHLTLDLFASTEGGNINKLFTIGSKLLIHSQSTTYATDGDTASSEQFLNGSFSLRARELGDGTHLVRSNNQYYHVRTKAGPVDVINEYINFDYNFLNGVLWRGKVFGARTKVDATGRHFVHYRADPTTGEVDTLMFTTYPPTASSTHEGAVLKDDFIYFLGPGDGIITALWRTDGSGAAPEMVYIVSTDPSSRYSDLMVLDDEFYVVESSFGESLLRISSDGTINSIEVTEQDESFIDIRMLSLEGGKVILTRDNLYRLGNDLTAEPFFPEPPAHVMPVEGQGLLIWRGQGNAEIWRSDGSVEGTERLIEFSTEELNYANGAAYYPPYTVFAANVDNTNGIYIYDHGTNLVTRYQHPYFDEPESTPPVFHQGRYYFVTNSLPYGEEAHYFDFGLKRSVAGLTYHDENGNGIYDESESAVTGIRVRAAGQPTVTTFSDEEGVYEMYLRPQTDFTVTTLTNPCWELTNDPAEYDITTTADSTISLNFGLRPTDGPGGLRVTLSSARPRCGFAVPYWLTVRNDGCQDLENVVASLALSAETRLESADLPPTTETPEQLSWVVDSLASGESVMITMVLRMPGEEFNGEPIELAAAVEGVYAGDIQVTDEFGYSETLSCAIDPNDKQVFPSRFDSLQSNYTQNDERVTYTIRFQNTGTDTAFTVRLEDQLSEHFDYSTFKPIAASHPNRATLKDDGRLEVVFDNILLPDSNVNQLLSNGFFTFELFLRPEIDDFTEVENTAGIFFDFNAPVITNTVRSTVVEFLDEDQDGFFFWEECDDEVAEINPTAAEIPNNGIDENCDGLDDFPVSVSRPGAINFTAFPNPVRDVLRLSADKPATVILADLHGRSHQEWVIFGERSVALDELPAGVYLLIVRGADGSGKTIRLVIQ